MRTTKRNKTRNSYWYGLLTAIIVFAIFGRVESVKAAFEVLQVVAGGTGASTIPAHRVVLGEGTTAIATVGAMTDGQLIVGATGIDPVARSLSGDVSSISSVGTVALNWSSPSAGIGGVAPQSGAFTTLSSSGLYSANGGITIAAVKPLILGAYTTAQLPGTCTDSSYVWDSTIAFPKSCFGNAWFPIPSGSGANPYDFSVAGAGAVGKTTTGANTFGGSSNAFTNAVTFNGGAAATSASAFDLSGGSGIFKPTTGVATFGGTSNAFTNSVAFNGGATASGANNFDLSGGSGQFKGPTGVATLSGTSLTLGLASTRTGSLVLADSSNANTFTIQPGVTGGNISWTVPTASASTAGSYLQSTTGGVLSWGTTDSDFCGYNSASTGLTGAISETTYTNASTVTTGSKLTYDITGTGGGSLVVKACTDGTTCAAGNTYLTWTVSCTAAAGTRTAAVVGNSGTIAAASVVTVSITTACTTDPAFSFCAHRTTP